MRRRGGLGVAAIAIGLASMNACSSSKSAAPQGTAAVFDASADLTSQASFYDMPFPLDLRLTAKGTPDYTGFPYPAIESLVNNIRTVAMEHPGWPVVPVAYFKFTGALPAIDPANVVAADPTSPFLLIDVDEGSPERGRLFPTVANALDTDDYTPPNTLAVAARPGFVLHGNRKYAFVVTRAFTDGAGAAISAPAAIDAMRSGGAPDGANGAALKTMFAPLWTALPIAHVDPASVITATVLTTGDVVAETSALADAVAAKYPITIDGLKEGPRNSIQDRYCEVTGSVTYPQFQVGKPPYDTDGLFDFSDNGLPAKQRDEVAPLVITLPKGEMPAAGYPLITYFHGSGGLSTAVVDRGTWHVESDATKCPDGTLETWLTTQGCNTAGQGPGYVVAPFGFAMAGSALPVNPERVTGAGELAYLNFNNLAAGRDTFRQGIVEQRMLLDALLRVKIPKSALGACTLSTLPAGATEFSFDASHVFAQGQSMGGMYTNLIGASEPRIKAVVPTGAGGYWSHFVLETPLIDYVVGKIQLVLDTRASLTFMHPAMFAFETAWEAVDPMVSMPRLARSPLPGHPVRPIYEPVGQGDSYFPEDTYDAMSLAYGNVEAGDVVWQAMQGALTLDGRGALASYPIAGNLTSETGAKYTGAVVQYVGDGVYDPHAIYSQLDAVKYQYGCFFSTMLQYGTPTIGAPEPLGSPCAH